MNATSRTKDDLRPTEVLRHGAYLCLTATPEARRAAAADLSALADRSGFVGEFRAVEGHPTDAIAFLRRIQTTPRTIADDGLLRADAIVHVASPRHDAVSEFCARAEHDLGESLLAILRGVVRPSNYTGGAMHRFAYEHQVIQQPAAAMPNAFLVPMSKTPQWWAKGWMERHTYFLPRYDDAGKMLCPGHALAAAPGIPCLMRRTYKNPTEPAPEGSYDFLNYFECADADIPTFHAVCSALRDVSRNPEWQFVREGPTWHGRRVASWSQLFA